MAGGLAALLDDIALIARNAAANADDVAAMAGKTGAKAAGVVIDDAAVAPKFVEGVTPARELPIIFRIGRGSLVNKLLLILPLALLLSAVAPWALTPLLMLGGAYLSFEGAEKVAEKLGWTAAHESSEVEQPLSENQLVRSAIMTDFILSAEIMVISLNEVAHETFGMRTIVLVVVAIAITLGVYGLVGVLVKMDDVGLHMMTKKSAATRSIGRGLVKAMPVVLTAIGIIGTFAMLWVGGHILLSGLDELGWHWPHDVVEAAESLVEPAGGAAVWSVSTLCALVFGLLVGGIIVAVVELISAVRRRRANPTTMTKHV